MSNSLRLGVISAVIGAAAGSAAATTLTLSNSNSTGGLDLNSVNVLLAASAVDSSPETVQTVPFTPMSYNSTTSIATASGSNITMTTSVAGNLPKYLTNNFEYANATVNDSTMTYGTSNTLGFNASNDALASLLNGGLEYSSANPLIITISGLTTGNQYVIDLLTSALGYQDRVQTVTFNGGSSLNPSSTPSASDGGSTGFYLYTANDGANGNAFGYDTNDTVTAVGGEITISLSSIVNTADTAGGTTKGANAPLFNALVISSATPEPASLALLAVGSLGLLARAGAHEGTGALTNL